MPRVSIYFYVHLCMMPIWIQQFRNVFKMNMEKNQMNQIEFQWILKRLIGYTFAIDLHFSHRKCDARNDSSPNRLLWNMATCLSECGFIGGLNELMTNKPVPRQNACTFSFASLFQACWEELNMNLNLMDAFDLCTIIIWFWLHRRPLRLFAQKSFAYFNPSSAMQKR